MNAPWTWAWTGHDTITVESAGLLDLPLGRVINEIASYQDPEHPLRLKIVAIHKRRTMTLQIVDPDPDPLRCPHCNGPAEAVDERCPDCWEFERRFAEPLEGLLNSSHGTPAQRAARRNRAHKLREELDTWLR